MVPLQPIELTHAEAQEYLMRRRDPHLMHLGALAYDQVRTILGLRQQRQLTALVMVVDYAGALPHPRPTMMVAADDQSALLTLLEHGSWPDRGVWTMAAPELRDVLEGWLYIRHSSTRGLNFYGAERPDNQQPLILALPDHDLAGLQVRQLTDRDATALDLSPCNLSTTALRGWLRQGWRVFGAVEHTHLVSHALAAYPIDDADEIAAVYTAARVRRRGIGAAVVAAVIQDNRARGRRAFYVANRSNLASCGLAERLGLATIAQTWEIVVEG